MKILRWLALSLIISFMPQQTSAGCVTGITLGAMFAEASGLSSLDRTHRLGIFA